MAKTNPAEHRRRAVVAAVEATLASVPDIANESGVSEDSIRFYKMGIRNPSPETVKALAGALSRRQRRLARAIERLREVQA